MIAERMFIPGPDAPPIVRSLRWIGIVGVIIILLTAVTTDPRPGLSGEGLWTTLGVVLFAGGVALGLQRGLLPDGWRAGSLAVILAGSLVLSAVQPHSGAIGGIYIVVIVAALRLRPRASIVVAGVAILAEALVIGLTRDDASGAIVGLVMTLVPWYAVMRLLGDLRDGRARAEQLVDELRETRAAHAEDAALRERARVARDMHDVLAHTLSGLALQLEGARLLARDRDADPAVVDAIERAHHLAAGGLDEARRAIGTLRGDALPGPEGLDALVADFQQQSAARARLEVAGTPRALSSEARLALYRTAQEALTNVRRHSAADSVELRLAWGDDGVTLEIADHGPGAPVAVGAGGGGYGLTGMRERAELLGGRLEARPTDDGFRVQLWLPA
jgi:signal transduction histidine kinase